MPAFKDLSGMRFGRLVAVVRCGTFKFGGAMWYCRCDCGNKCEAPASGLRSGNNTSCGCKGAEQIADLAKRTLTKHGHAGEAGKSPEYRTWLGIRRRCRDVDDNGYPQYGARGITVCDRWFDSFDAFLEDMGHRPAGRYTIDRIENSKGYEPGNCRWATYRTQQNNRTNNHMITFQGETLTLAEWARRIGIKAPTLERRINLYGWSIPDALTTPVRP